ncbi:putative sodium/hydrogen antiporter [Anaerolinea thermophila UNI-1]|uniref:Sodium/hydrogen antiporter n=2 Tax=Anaerolineaceae TaxID=292628 RepID=E8MZW7_ANATU|nr:putative sodium/hydrogen antiporter [Anaerolinea thermophila UNI-1]
MPMSPFLQLSITLAIIIFAAKIAGWVSQRFGQPSVFGELLVGVLLGPSLLNLTHLPFITDSHLDEIVRELGEMGVLILMFLAGLELELGEMARNGRVSVLAGLLGVVFPVGLGAAVGFASGMETRSALFLGLALGATSVSISAQTLMELGILRSRVGLGLLGAAVFDDIFVILLLSVMTALVDGASGASAVIMTILRMAGFLVLSVLVGMYVLPFFSRLLARLQISRGNVAMAVVVMLVYAVAAELIGGMAAITGAFLAGMMVGRSGEKRSVENGFAMLGYSFFIPIFFVDVGLRINLTELPLEALWLALIVSLVAVAGKWIGAGLGAKLAGFTWRESMQLGAGMISRGEVGLIVAAIGLSEGLLSREFFSTVVGMVLISTLITPPLLRWVCTLPSPKPKVREVS